jgi:hypothetical protein
MSCVQIRDDLEFASAFIELVPWKLFSLETGERLDSKERARADKRAEESREHISDVP